MDIQERVYRVEIADTAKVERLKDELRESRRYATELQEELDRLKDGSAFAEMERQNAQFKNGLRETANEVRNFLIATGNMTSGRSERIQQISNALERIRSGAITSLQAMKELGVTPFESLVTKLEQISDAVDKVQDSISKTGGSVGKDIVGDSNSLVSSVDRIIEKLNEMLDVMQKISKNPLKIDFGSGSKGNSNDLTEIELRKKQLQEYLNLVDQMQISLTRDSRLLSGQSRDLMRAFFGFGKAGGRSADDAAYDKAKLFVNIDSAATDKGLATVESKLNYFKAMLDEAYENAQKKNLSPPEIDTRAYDEATEKLNAYRETMVATAKERQNAVRQIADIMTNGQAANQAGTTTLDQAKVSGDLSAMSTQLDSVRAKLEEVFNLSTIDLHLPEVVAKIQDAFSGSIFDLNGAARQSGAVQQNSGVVEQIEQIAERSIDASHSADILTESLQRVSQISVELSGENIEEIGDALKSGGVDGDVADKIASAFDGLSGRIKDVKVRFNELGDGSENVGQVIVNAMTDAGKEIQRVITLLRDEEGAPDYNVSGSAKVKFDLAEQFKEATSAAKAYYALLQKMAQPSVSSQYLRQNVEEQNGSFVAKAEDVREYVNQLNTAKTAMESYLSTLSADNSTEKQRKDLEALIDTMEKRHDLMMETASRADAERAQKEENKVYEEANQLLKEMIQLREQYGNKLKVRASEAFGNNEKNIEELRMLVASGAPIDEIVAKLKEMRVATDENGQSMKSLGSSAKSTFSGMMRYMAMTFSSYRLIMMTVREIKKMISTSIELDSAMTQMQIVTRASDATMRQFGQTAAQVAKETATSISDVIDSATVFARLGYSLDESAILSKYTGMLQRVGNIEVSDAQDAITAIIKAYDIDAENIESVMDKLVEVGNNFPISVEQIAEGMNNAAAALSAAGNSFEESVALLTAANTIVQNASKASTGLRTIAARLRNTKAELDELGEEPLAVPKYEELVKQLTDYNVSLVDAAGNYRSTYAIMRDLAGVWDDIAPNIQAAITTALAGTRQQAIFNSIISEFKEASGAMDAMTDSAGALSNAYNTYMDSTQAHIDQFKAAFQELSQTAIDSGFISDVVDRGTDLINLLSKVSGFIDVIGGLRTVLIATIGTIVTLKITQWISNIQRVGRAIKALATDHERFSRMLKNNKASWASFWAGVATLAITAIAAISSAIKKQREEALLATKTEYDAAFREAKKGDAAANAFENYANAKLAIDDNISSKAKLTQSTLELAKALGIETSAISGTKKELEELSHLEMKDAIKKADEAVKAAQAVLFGDTYAGLGMSKAQTTIRQYAVGYFQKAAKESGYTRLWDGTVDSYASDFAAWFESPDLERRVDAIKRVYKYMQEMLDEMYSTNDSSVLTSSAYTNLLEAVNFLKTDIDALEDAEKLLKDRTEQYNKIVEKLQDAVRRSGESAGDATKTLTEYGESAKILSESLSDAWGLEDFAKTKEELIKLTKEVNGITPDKIIELAKESDVLSLALQQDGMDARFLAHVLQTELTGGDGFGLITEQALLLNDALNGLNDEFNHLANSRAKYEANKSGPEVDDDFKSMADAYKSLNEEFEKGRVGSNAFWNSAEFLFGAEQLEEWEFSAERVQEAMERNKVVFEDADSAGAGFLTRLKELSDANGDVVGEDGGILASIQQLADGTIEFDVDDLRLDELSKKMGISRDAIIACSKALRAFGRVDMTDMRQVLNAMKEIGLGADFNDTSIVNAIEAYDMLRNTLGYNAKEAHDVMDGLEAMGVTIVDLNAPTEELAQQFVELGIAEDNAGTFTVNIDGLIALMQALGLTKDQAVELVNTLGQAGGVSFSNTEGNAVSLDKALESVNSADFKSVEGAADGLSKELDVSKMTAEELYKELKELTGVDYTIQMDRRYLEAALSTARQLKAALDALKGKSAYTYHTDSRGYSTTTDYGAAGARGITNAAPGKTLVGEEEPELWVQGDQARLVGTHGPEIIETKAGDKVYKGSDTRKILKNVRFIRGTIPAFKYGGSVSIPGWTGSSSAPASAPTSAASYSGSSSSSSSSKSGKKEESAFEKAYKEHQHLLKMDAETTKDYLTWLNSAYKTAFKNNQIELDDYRKYEEEVYEGMKDLFMDYLSDIEHELDMLDNNKSTINRTIKLYNDMVKAIEKEIAAARKAGLKDTDDYIQQLQKKLKSATKELAGVQEDALKEYEEAQNDLIDARVSMIKQEIDNEKDALNERLSNIKDFYQKQKDLLRENRDEEKYLDDQAEKRKKVSDLELKLTALEMDNSAWAQKRKLQLEQELSDARKELREFEKDHAIDVAQGEIDKLQELREKEIEGQIENLDNITPKQIYDWAVQDIENANNALYNAMIDWNNVYGDGIEKTIISKWERATEAFNHYCNVVRAAANGGDSVMMSLSKGFLRMLDIENIGGPNRPNYVSRYAYGTSHATPGLHMLDELGTETIFQSKNGQKYRMFTGGEKVLNAKASDFLYKFATSGGELLAKMFRGSSGGIDNILSGGRRLAVEAVNMGDIIINGNADRATVSEIRRAQRDALDNLLHEFDRLSR